VRLYRISFTKYLYIMENKNDLRLTEHFTLSEFTRSSVASLNGIDNTIDMQSPQGKMVVENLRNLCENVLEPLRQYANEPVIITSGYRCPTLNNLVGGAVHSQHLTGEAVDIWHEEGIRLRQWYIWLMDNTRFDQLIFESKGNEYWIHVSLCRDDARNRQRALRVKKG